MTTSGAPARGRFDHTAVWTGEEMIVFGGMDHPRLNETVAPTRVIDGLTFAPIVVDDATGGGSNVGARYHPRSNTWNPIRPFSGTRNYPTLPLSDPNCFTRHRAVWTGSKMVIIGGRQFCAGSNYNVVAFNSGSQLGGVYNLVTDSWVTMSRTNAPPATADSSVVWTGNRLIVFGGGPQGSNGTNRGGIFDPESNSWSLTTTTGAPQGRLRHTAVWTGNKMIIFGGRASGYTEGSSGPGLNTGGIYDPTMNSWIPTPTVDAPSPRSAHTAVWTGKKMIVFGGMTNFVTTNTGGIFDPESNTWSPISTVGAPSPRRGHSAVWTGNKMIVFGGTAVGGVGAAALGDGGIYDPATDTWTPLAPSNRPSARTNHTAIWTGSQMLIYGGSPKLTDGSMFERTAVSDFIATGGVFQ